MLEPVDWRLVEAVHSVRRIFKSLEKTVYAGKFESGGNFSGNGRQFDVAIPLHSLLEATQQHVDTRAIELPQFGTVEHDTRPIAIQGRLNVTEKKSALLHT
jgi:hypothetical protein